MVSFTPDVEVVTHVPDGCSETSPTEEAIFTGRPGANWQRMWPAELRGLFIAIISTRVMTLMFIQGVLVE